jgi:hypothetical protein
MMTLIKQAIQILLLGLLALLTILSVGIGFWWRYPLVLQGGNQPMFCGVGCEAAPHSTKHGQT